MFINREQFAKHGPSCAFGPHADGSVLTVEYHRQSIEKRVMARMKMMQASRESLITAPSALDKEMVVYQVSDVIQARDGQLSLSCLPWHAV